MSFQFRPAARDRQCAHCNKMFQTKPSRKAKFCSQKCYSESQRTRTRNDPRPCVVCGTVFKPSRGCGDAKYCSKSCIWKATKGPEFNARIARAHAQKRGDKQRGRGSGKGYRKRNGRHEHRVVAEEMLGRPLLKGEIVHHIDGNPQNNEPDNLKVMTQAEHIQEHGLAIPGKPLAHKPWEHR